MDAERGEGAICPVCGEPEMTMMHDKCREKAKAEEPTGEKSKEGEKPFADYYRRVNEMLGMERIRELNGMLMDAARAEQESEVTGEGAGEAASAITTLENGIGQGIADLEEALRSISKIREARETRRLGRLRKGGESRKY